MNRQGRGRDWMRRLLLNALVKLAGGAVLLGLSLFFAAGTFRYWQAWIYMALLIACMSVVMVYLYRNDPELLERRLKAREKEHVQRWVQALYTPVVLGLWILPGFDVRWRWSSVPVAVVLLADALVVASYLLFFRVVRANSFAARTVEVEPGQRLVTTGPYAVVRHPMYTAIIGIYVGTPLALGSYWALLAAVPLPFVLALRIRNEEEVLLRDFPEYKAYRRRTRSRLIPRVW